MPLDNPQAGTGYAAEFQSSALPWVTSSVAAIGDPQRLNFDHVSRFITVLNNGAGTDKLGFGFTFNGTTGSNFFQLNAGQSVTVELRVAEMYIKAISGTPAYSVCAGMTTVPVKFMGQLTGSDGWTGIG